MQSLVLNTFIIFQRYPGFICLEARIKFKPAKTEMLEIVKDRRTRRLQTQPLEYPSAGSVFRILTMK